MSSRQERFKPPTKRSRDADELAALAERFKADWRSGDRVMTWLNRHEGRNGELSALVEDGWSWADIGQAMHLAGIFFGTGKPIPADTLRGKAWKARRHERQRAAPRPEVAPALEAPRNTPSTVLALPPPASTQPAEPDEDEPEFRPVSFLKWDAKASPQKAPESLPPLPSETRKQRSPDEVAQMLARLAGKP